MFQKPVKTVHESTPICQFISKAACSELQPYLSQFNYSKQTEEQRCNITKSFYIHASNTQKCRRTVPTPLPHPVADNHTASREPPGTSCTAARVVASAPHTNKRSLDFPMLHGRSWVVTPAPLGPAGPFCCGKECSYTAPLWQVHSTAMRLLAPSTAPTPQGPCKEQAIHKAVADGKFTIWKEAAAITCASMSHCTTKSLFTYFLLTCEKRKYEALLPY